MTDPTARRNDGTSRPPFRADHVGSLLRPKALRDQDEIRECAQAGAQYVQLDEVALVMLCDEVTRQRLRAEGHDPQELVDLYVDAINEAVANRPPELLVGVHVCRGKFKGKYLAEGGYELRGGRRWPMFDRLSIAARTCGRITVFGGRAQTGAQH